MKLANWILVGALAAGATAYADEKNEERHPQNTVTMAELPAPVKTTVQREAKGKTIEWMAKDQDNGKTIYKVEVVANDKGQVIDISDTGKVLQRHATHDEKTESEHGNK